MSIFDRIADWFNRDEYDYSEYDYYGSIHNTSPYFNDYCSDEKKVTAVLRSPAVLKVFKLQCDLFSLGIPYVYKNGEEQKDDPVLKLFNNPNPMQSRTQFLWDFMFWNMLGTANLYCDSDLADESNKMYFLDPRKMEVPYNLEMKSDKLFLSKKAIEDLGKEIITYRYKDGKDLKIPFSRITVITDLTNGMGNWFKSPSAIDALYKIISNSEENLDAKNINTKMTSKFLVAGTADPSDVKTLPLSDTEKRDIESKVMSRKKIHAVKSMIEIKRFVENLANLKLGAAYLEDYFLIGSMYGIPRDVLEAYNSSTYENQEKARASHVSYTLQPKGNDFFEALAKRFGYDLQGKTIIIDWAHLPFMQVFEKDTAQTRQIQVNTFILLMDQGVPLDEINKYLDTGFTKAMVNAKAGGVQSKFKIGDNVMVIPGKEHMPEHAGVDMTIAEINGDTYAVQLPDGSVHKWYTGSELMAM